MAAEEGRLLPVGYHALLSEIKQQVRSSQLTAALALNRELIDLYWKIGRAILGRQRAEGWGAKTTERLASDLNSSFPQMKGFSFRNLKYMVHFAKTYPDLANGQQVVAQIPWGHNIVLLQKLNTNEERIWYAYRTLQNGWSRSLLLHWIESGLHKRQGKAVNNFELTLPPPQSDLATQTLKDPYSFDFLTLRERFDEKELEEGLLNHIQKFLLELGAGFAFVGRQVELIVGDQEFYVDLLFYHLKLRCYIVVELKARAFTPEDAGKLNFYLTAVDRLLRHPDDAPTIGMLLCKTKNEVIAEYALRDIHKPMGVAEYQTMLVESLPDDLQGSLPSIEEIEQELAEN